MDSLTTQILLDPIDDGGHRAAFRPAPGKVPTTARLAPRIMLLRDGAGPVGSDAERLVGAAGGGGQPLPADLRARFEGSLGADLSAVRVHTGHASAEASAAVGARAYALGDDIHFGAGQYRPDDPFGLHLLAHEVAHTVQHQGAGAGPAFKLEIGAPHDAAEHEADRAADAMVAGQAFAISGRGGGLQLRRSPLTPDQKKAWDDAKGDDVVRKLQALASAWTAFAASPTRFSAMPGKGTCDPVKDEVEKLLGIDGSFRGYLQGQLGGAVGALNQMVSINQLECGHLSGVVPGVVFAPPNHQYRLTAKSMGKNVSQLHISYSNRFGWSWSQEMSGKFFGVKLDLGASVKPGKGGKKPSIKPGGGVSPGGFDLEVSVAASGKPAAYWGLDDLPGAVTVATMEAELPIGGTVGLGGAIKIVGNGHPGTLDFLAPTVGPSGGKPSPGMKVTLTEGAGSMSVGPKDDRTITPPPTTPSKAVRDGKEWSATIRSFATGHADVAMPEDVVRAQIDPIEVQLKQLAEQQAAIAAELEAAGVPEQDRAFKVDVSSVGYASRRWRDARGDGERVARNQALSERRAQEVVMICRPIFGPEHAYTATGRGAAGLDNRDFSVHPEQDQELERRIAEERARLRAAHPDWDDKKLDADARKHFSGKSDDDSETRRVELTVRWMGWRLDYAGAPAPAPGGKGDAP